MKYSRLSRYKIKKTIEFFCGDITATLTSMMLRINRNKVNNYCSLFCKLILEHSLAEEKKESGEFELDKSYFGARRVRGKRVQEAAGKTLLKREDVRSL